MYSYNWNDGLYNTDDLDQIGAGSYTVVITDENGCDVTTTVVLEETEEGINVSHDTSLDTIYAGYGVSSNGATDGSIDITVSGGTGVYSYNWNDGLYSTEDLDQIGAGSYTLIVEDENGCSFTTNVDITQPDEMILTNDDNLQNLYENGDSFWAVPCFGDETGAIDIEVTGGAEPINYVWTNSDEDIVSTDEDLENIGADIYTVTVTDSNGNTIIQSIDVDQPPSLIYISLTNPIVNVLPCYGDETGQINIDIEDGLENTNYSFEWTDTNNNIVSSEQNLVNFGAGIYTVIATDPNGCAGTETYEIQ